MGILDAIINTKQTEHFNSFSPKQVVAEILNLLKERDRQIISNRYGLDGKPVKTLAAIGQEQGLTRERVRQIEKDLIKNLKKTSLKLEKFTKTKDFLLNLIIEHGRIVAEENLMIQLGLQDEEEKNSVVFLLNLIEELDNFIHKNFKKAWIAVLFKEELLHSFREHGTNIITNKKTPLESQEFLENFKQTEFYLNNKEHLTDKVILNFLELVVEIEKNVFGHWGMSFWKDVKPKDVGDKAYLVMKHHKKPEHYSVITQMINKKKFDNRVAYKETVHNELIKDTRFILIGRGIYGLAEWGYKPGVVSDVIKEVLQESGKPMSKEDIVNKVLEKRMVKKNTVLVGLSNRKMFKKVDKNLYYLV